MLHNMQFQDHPEEHRVQEALLDPVCGGYGQDILSELMTQLSRSNLGFQPTLNTSPTPNASQIQLTLAKQAFS
jgi:hypothetical protein